MPEDLRKTLDVAAPLLPVSREGVAKQVAAQSPPARRVRVLDASDLAGVSNDSVDLASGENAPTIREEEGARRAFANEQPKIAEELLGDGDGTLFAAFSGSDREASELEIEIAYIKCCNFGAAHSGQRLKTTNLHYLAKGERILELCKGVSAAYVTKEVHEQAAFLRIISSNLATDGVTVSATYERPFDVLAERPARSNWLPRQDANRTAELILQALTAA